MRASGRLALLGYNLAAAVVGLAAMVALVRAAMVDSPQVAQRGGARFFSPEVASQANRFVFVPPGALSRPEPPAADPRLRPSITNASDNPGAWSTEVQPETTPAIPPQSGRQFTLLPALRLPTQIAKPAVPRRTYTLNARLAEIAPLASTRLAAKFEAGQAVWPPAEIVLIAIKDEKLLELHTRPSGGAWRLIHRYRVLAASGAAGPKLRQGDKQVPEGVYSIAFLNPNSAYHVSLAVNYPNAFDRQMAAKDGRKDLGGDIMIHGRNLSAGCLAMGDEAVEELFVLAARTGLANVKLIIAPTDLRQHGLPALEPGQPEWLPKLYAEIATAMSEFKAPPRNTGLLSFFTR